MGEVHGFGFNLAVSLLSDRKSCKARIVLLPSRIKRWDLYHESEKRDHKPTIHRISTNTPQKELHQIDLQEDRGEHCIEIQRERRSNLATSYGPEGLK